MRGRAGSSSHECWMSPSSTLPTWQLGGPKPEVGEIGSASPEVGKRRARCCSATPAGEECPLLLRPGTLLHSLLDAALLSLAANPGGRRALLNDLGASAESGSVAARPHIVLPPQHRIRPSPARHRCAGPAPPPLRQIWPSLESGAPRWAGFGVLRRGGREAKGLEVQSSAATRARAVVCRNAGSGLWGHRGRVVRHRRGKERGAVGEGCGGVCEEEGRED
jgi:hypothetical protein